MSAPTLPRSRMWAADLLAEAVAGLFGRPLRTALTVLGIVVGLTALVATLGLSRTAANRIVARFDELAATQVTVTALPAPPGAATNVLPWDAEARLLRLDGVAAAGTLTSVDIGETLVTASPISDPQRRTTHRLAVEAASPGLFDAVRARVRTGRLPDAGHSARADRVAVLGPNAAARLGIVRLDHQPAIRVGDETFVVVAILDRVERQHGLLSAVIVPEGTAQQHFRVLAPGAVVVETRVGAADLIARQAPLALQPNAPNGLKVVAPQQPANLRAGVSGDLEALFLMLGAVSLVVGAIGIANVMLVSVMERVGEIGLRRALGATRRHIAGQFLLESAVMGAIGGILGTSAGMLLVVGVSAANTWEPVVDPYVLVLAPILGAVVGLVAGAYPAIRAARLEPVEALRGGT